MNGPNILIARDGRIRRIISGERVYGALSGSALFAFSEAGEFAERVAVGAEDGQDALLGEKEFLFGEDFQGVVEAQTLRFGPVVIAVAEHFVASGDQGFVASSGHVVCFLVG